MRSRPARQLPEISASASAGVAAEHRQRHRLPAGIDLPHRWNDSGQVALSFSFDLDLWGRNRATLRAALSDAEAARADAGQRPAAPLDRRSPRPMPTLPASPRFATPTKPIFVFAARRCG